MTRSRLFTAWLWTLCILPIVIVLILIVCALFALNIPTPDAQLPTL